MKKTLLWLLALCLIWGALPAAAQAAFDDVADTAYYAQAVQWAVDRGITSGTSATTFSPGDTCTRGQILTFLWRAAGCLSAEGQILPEDVPAGAYYAKAVLWGRQQNLFADGPFRPDAPCTRAMAVELMWRAAGCPVAAVSAAFADVPASGDIQSAVAWAVDQGITSGTGETTFSPDDTCTRGQIVTLLHRAFGEQEQNPNQDAGQPATPGRTPVTEIGQMYGTYVTERFTAVVSAAAPSKVRIEVYTNALLAADPNRGPSVTGTLPVSSKDGTLHAAWDGFEIAVYQECLVLTPPDRFPHMAGVYQRQSGDLAQDPSEKAPAASGRTPVTEIGQMYGTYVGERYTVVVSEAAPTVRIAIYKNSFLAADPNCEPSVAGTLVVVRGETETLDAAWNGLKITVYQECLVLESPDKLPHMAGVYQRQSAQ